VCVCVCVCVCVWCAALLAAYTYDVRTGQYTKLMTVQESPLGAAYRNLTNISTAKIGSSSSTATLQHSSTGAVAAIASPMAAAAAGAASWPSPRSYAATAAASPGSEKPQGSLLAHRRVGAVAAPSSMKGSKHKPQGTLGAAAACLVQKPPAAAAANPSSPNGAAACISPPTAAAAAATARGSFAAPSAAQSTASSPRRLAYAVPLQPIRPTDSLLAAAAEAGSIAAAAQTAHTVQPGGLTCGSAASGLQFHVSVLARFPFLVKDLAAAELLDAGEVTAAGLCCTTEVRGPAAAGGLDLRDGSRSHSSSSDGGADASRPDVHDACCVHSQVPCRLHGKPGMNSLGAYVQRTKLQQVGSDTAGQVCSPCGKDRPVTNTAHAVINTAHVDSLVQNKHMHTGLSPSTRRNIIVDQAPEASSLVTITVLSQVDAFKEKLVREAELAAQAAAAASLAKQQAAAAKTMTDASELAGRCSAPAPAVCSFMMRSAGGCTAHSSGMQRRYSSQRAWHPGAARLCLLHAGNLAVSLNTSNISRPLYWPDTTTDAAAAAQALKQQSEAVAAARLAALRELRQQAASKAARNEQHRRQSVKKAAQRDKQVTHLPPCVWLHAVR
jgi:hypothetical protein